MRIEGIEVEFPARYRIHAGGASICDDLVRSDDRHLHRDTLLVHRHHRQSRQARHHGATVGWGTVQARQRLPAGDTFWSEQHSQLPAVHDRARCLLLDIYWQRRIRSRGERDPRRRLLRAAYQRRDVNRSSD